MRHTHSGWGTAALLVLGALFASAACSEPPPTRTAKAQISLGPALLDFGAVAPGDSKTLNLTIANDGQFPLNITGFEIRNDARNAFTHGDVPAQVAPGTSETVAITYKAAPEPTSDSGNIVVTSEADNAPTASVPMLAKTVSAQCTDKVQNGSETAVDCGGSCPGCEAGKACASASDCASGLACAGRLCGVCTENEQCRTGEICKGGACTGCSADADCPAGNTCVEGGRCQPCPGATGAIDTRTDPKNCGGCGVVCQAPAHAAAVCTAGRCGRGPCARGYFDLDGAVTFGCENACTGKVCTGPGGQTRLDNEPIPESNLGLHAIASGSSLGGAVQTSQNHTLIGVLGESTPGSSDGTTELKSARFRLKAGLSSTLH